MCDDNGKLAGYSGEKYIRFRGKVVPGMPSGDTHVDLEVVDRPLDDGAYLIEPAPFIRIPLDAGEHPQFHIFISIGSPSLFDCGAGIFTVTDPLPLHHMDFWASPFETVGAPLFFCNTTVFHGKFRVIGACRVAIFIIADFFERAFIARVVRDEGLGKPGIIQQEAVDIGRVKGGIAQENAGMEGRVGEEIIGEDAL